MNVVGKNVPLFFLVSSSEESRIAYLILRQLFPNSKVDRSIEKPKLLGQTEVRSALEMLANKNELRDAISTCNITLLALSCFTGSGALAVLCLVQCAYQSDTGTVPAES